MKYQSVETSAPLVGSVVTKNYRCILYSFIATVLILVALSIFTIVYVVDNESASSSQSTCLTEECVELSSQLLSWMNVSADPCQDFFEYACGGFKEKYRFQLSKYPQWTTEWSNMNQMGAERRDKFLDFLYDENDELHSHESIIAIKTFYKTCYDSTVEEEQIANTNLLQEFINVVNFTSGNFDDTEWDNNAAIGFNNALSWLSLRDWNDLFEIDVYEQGTPSILQQFNYWTDFNATQWNDEMTNVYIPLYENVFGLDATQSQIIADLVVDFMSQIASFNISAPYYGDIDDLVNHIENISFDEFMNSNLFSSNDVVNYTNIILGTFNVSMNSLLDDINSLIYIPNDAKFYGNLSELIEGTPPFVIQYWLFTNILYHYFDFVNEDAFDQPRSEDRRQFCYDLTRTSFTFLYAHIYISKNYDRDAQTMVKELVDDIIDEGLVRLVNEADWIDEESKVEMIKKGTEIYTYMGVPDGVRNITFMDNYYGKLKFNENDFVDNYEMLINFNSLHKMALFYNYNTHDVNFVEPWPHMFNSPSLAPSWLTGISAFYMSRTVGDDRGNYFAIPALITSNPFFNKNYPSAINYGGIGFVIGHEISHGFDPSGSLWDWKGDEIDTWSNITRELYTERVQCIIDKYDQFEIEPGVFVNGYNSRGENVADNAGMEEAWTAYKKSHKLKNDLDKYNLPGIPEFSHDKLFWIGQAQTRCDAWRDDYYGQVMDSGYYRSHSPRIARVNAVVVNQKGFAQAFKCAKGTPMNPEDKCHIWFDY